ncbi:AGAP005808-PA-like protein [Anopheles sinensis]|uniref:AGAP005808-PA-like protein n=1 Tax=Anopheles sinensis TaxID=74873 RepID=A0A084WDG6_ANOSI|nr:AGAP005808-PA-like protein [Anopheles sinensis]
MLLKRPPVPVANGAPVMKWTWMGCLHSSAIVALDPRKSRSSAADSNEHPRPVPSRISVASPRTPSHRNVFKSSELSAGDNDVTNADGGHDHPRRTLQRTSPDHAGRPTMYVFRSSADGVNVGVDYFRTNFTDGTSANTACNLGEEQNKYRTVGPVDKSIVAGPGDDGTQWAGVGESRSDTPADTGAYAMALHGEQLQPAFGAPVPRMISFTDGEFIFGPIDERALEFERLELLTGDKLPGRPADEATCTCPVTGFDVRERHSDASPFGSPDGQGQLTSPGAGNVAMSNLTPHSTESHTGTPEDGKLISAPGEKPAPDEGKETDADDGDEQKIAPSPPVETTDADAGYERWSRFENGNISPPAGGNCATDTDTGRDGRTAKRLTRGDEIEEIFQQLNQSLKANVTKGASGGSDEKLPDALPSYGAAIGQLVENVPVIDSILDDLLAFSKQLLRKQQLAESERQRVMAKRQPSPSPPPAKTSPIDTEVNANREPAHLTEINDDNLINLLAVGDDAGRKEPDDRGDAVDKSHHNEREDNGGQGSERPGVSIGRENENAKKPMANSDRNSNQRPGFAFEHEPGGATGPTPREDVFSNVAIFNWNPLDVYQQHGLFMIDPRFAPADMRATSPSFHPKASPSHPMVEEEVDTRYTTVNDENDSVTRRLHRQPGVSIDRSSDSEIDNPDTGDNFIPTTDVKFPLQHSRLHDKNRFPATNASSVAATDWKMNTCRNYCQPSDDPLTTTSTAVEHDQLDKIVQMNQVLHVFDACHARYPLDGRAGGKVQAENTAPTTATTTLQSNCNPPAEGMSSSLV